MFTVLKKYKQVIFPLALLIIFDLALLTVNFNLSTQLETTSVNINIAGRQRMLSQRMTKALLLIHYKVVRQQSAVADLRELYDTVWLFDQTLNAFAHGGIISNANGHNIMIRGLQHTGSREALDMAMHLWQPLQRQLTDLSPGAISSATGIIPLIDLMAVENIKLLNLMNELTNQLEQQAKYKTLFLRALQMAIVILTLLAFFIATLRLYRREKYYDDLMEKSTDIILGIDVESGLTTFVSQSIYTLLGHRDDYYLGRPANLLFDDNSAKLLSEILDYIEETGELKAPRCEVGLCCFDGRTLVADMVMQLMRSENGKATELSADIRDISERKAVENTLTELAHKDILTGLPNRIWFMELAQQSLKLARRRDYRVAVMYIDLDGFKTINDEFGHNVGDKTLIEVARRMTRCLRITDYVARIGGDEFVVLIEHVTDEKAIKELAEKMINELSKPIMTEDSSCYVGASVGIAFYPDNGDDIETLLSSADEAMYHVKQQGKNAVAFYS